MEYQTLENIVQRATELESQVRNKSGDGALSRSDMDNVWDKIRAMQQSLEDEMDALESTQEGMTTGATTEERSAARVQWYGASRAVSRAEKALNDVRLLMEGACPVNVDDIPAPLDLARIQDFVDTLDNLPATAVRARWGEVDLPEENMRTRALERVQWDHWRPYLVTYCLNNTFRAIRHGGSYGESMQTPFRDNIHEKLPPVSANGKKQFEDLRRRVALDSDTGALYLRYREGQEIKIKRILGEMNEKQAVFARYWYDPAVCGQRGRDTTFERLAAGFYNISRQEVHLFIQQTETYQVSSKTHNMEKVTNPLQTSGPMEHLQMDLVDYSRFERQNNGYNYLLVVIDCFSKFVWAYPLKNKKAESVLACLRGLFFCEGIPRILQSDNGGEFVAKENIRFYQDLGIVYRTGRAYKPSTQGQVERTNRTLKQAIYHDFLSSGTQNWVDRLPERLWVYNTVHATGTGRTPYEQHRYRRPLWMPTPEALRENVRTLLPAGSQPQIQAWKRMLIANSETATVEEIENAVVSDERLLMLVGAEGGGVTALTPAQTEGLTRALASDIALSNARQQGNLPAYPNLLLSVLDQNRSAVAVHNEMPLVGPSAPSKKQKKRQNEGVGKKTSNKEKPLGKRKSKKKQRMDL
jgi:transposase InsO family protein